PAIFSYHVSPWVMLWDLSRISGSGKDWLIDVPSRVSVLQNSCVVIPCSYVYPKVRKMLKTWRGYWKRRGTVVASNFPNAKLTDEFHHRSRIRGTLQSGNCTWQLNRVRETDTGPFYFKIEIPQHKTFTFSQNTVTLDVFREYIRGLFTNSKPFTLRLTATCKVTHVCPSSPPKFSWSHSGTRKTNLQKTVSTLTFTASAKDNGKSLTCYATFPGGQTQEKSMTIRVKREFVPFCFYVFFRKHAQSGLVFHYSRKRNRNERIMCHHSLHVFLQQRQTGWPGSCLVLVPK
uniref:Ig-like domain-containing protein n=1 Tax=Xiphophorus couchianus TaxID=32473 RepID=A0A3B5LBU1_9TELE